MHARSLVLAPSFSVRLHLGALGLAALTLGGCQSGPRDSAAAASSAAGPSATAVASVAPVTAPAPVKVPFAPSRAGCETVPVFSAGEPDGRVCADDAAASGLTVVDLSDTWTPRVFAPDPGTHAAPEYRARYLELASQAGADPRPLRHRPDPLGRRGAPRRRASPRVPCRDRSQPPRRAPRCSGRIARAARQLRAEGAGGARGDRHGAGRADLRRAPPQGRGERRDGRVDGGRAGGLPPPPPHRRRRLRRRHAGGARARRRRAGAARPPAGPARARRHGGGAPRGRLGLRRTRAGGGPRDRPLVLRAAGRRRAPGRRGRPRGRGHRSRGAGARVDQPRRGAGVPGGAGEGGRTRPARRRGAAGGALVPREGDGSPRGDRSRRRVLRDAGAGRRRAQAARGGAWPDLRAVREGRRPRPSAGALVDHHRRLEEGAHRGGRGRHEVQGERRRRSRVAPDPGGARVAPAGLHPGGRFSSTRPRTGASR